MFYVLVFGLVVTLLALLVRRVDERRHPPAPAPAMPLILRRKPADHRRVSGDADDWLGDAGAATVSHGHFHATSPMHGDSYDVDMDVDASS